MAKKKASKKASGGTKKRPKNRPIVLRAPAASKEEKDKLLNPPEE